MKGNGISISLKNCGYNISEDIEAIKGFITEVVRIIDMNPLGDIVVRKGTDHLPGYTVVQIIETSHIALHTFSQDNSYLLNIESCKPFDTNTLKEFIFGMLQPEKENIKINSEYEVEI